jgi:hypothetical protein
MLQQDIDRFRLIRLPVHAGDPDRVFEEVAGLLAAYGERVGHDVDKIVAQCSGPEDLQIAAAAYLTEIGSNVVDRTIRAAVKRCARARFKIRGCNIEEAA